MDLYEYQARNLFRQHGVPVLGGAAAATPKKARSIAWSPLSAGSELVVVKAQVETGGRGRVDDVKLTRTAEEAEAHARDILGMGIKGHTVRVVPISDGVDLDVEYYFSVLLDRAERQYLAMCSCEGGADIETSAVEYPEALAHIGIDLLKSITSAVSHRIVEAAGFKVGPLADEIVAVTEHLWEVFTTEDATLAGVDSLVRTVDGHIIALDDRVTLNDDSRFRHPAHAKFIDNAVTDPLEARTREAGLNYVRLEGEAGVLSNGVDLIMSILDVATGVGERYGNIKSANFLDLGGGSSAEVTATGLEVVASDPQAHAILVNVFGGITSCDTVAQSIVTAVESLGGLPKLVVVRLGSSNTDTGYAIPANAAIEGVTVVDTMDGATDVVTATAKEISGRLAGKEAWGVSIFPTEADRIIIQGMTSSEGRRHTTRMLSAGMKVVAGVNPRKTGTTAAFDVIPIGPGVGEVQAGTVEIPVCGTIAEAKEAIGAEVSVVFVPFAFAKDTVVETVDIGACLLVVITEDIPVTDATWMYAYTAEYDAQIIDPNCPGIISPTRSNVGITPSDITDPDPLGLVSESGTLTYQLIHELSDLGFTTCTGIGGDPVVDTTHIDVLAVLETDPDTRLVVMIGEIGDDTKEQVATYIRKYMTRPVVTYVAGLTVPEGRTTRHTGVVVSNSLDTAEVKKIALKAVGTRVGRTPSQTTEIIRKPYRQLTEEVSA